MMMEDRKRILVVDDEEAVVFVLSKSLKKLGDKYEIVTAHDGYEALEKIQESSFDLVITDLRMPGMNGIQLTEAIQAQSPGTTVIWATAYGSPQIEAEAARLDVHRYLSKPLDVDEIRRIAQAALATIQEQRDDTPPPINDQVRVCLDELQSETGAYTTFLLTTGGQVVDVVGSTQGLDIATLSALMAGNFLAAHEIARMLGQESTFKVSYHESDQYKVYAYGVGASFLLVIVFGKETPPGVVWLYARRAADELVPLLADQQGAARLQEVLDGDFEVDLQRELDDLFQLSPADQTEPQKGLPAQPADSPEAPQTLFSLEEAIRQGLISFDD